MAQKLHTYEAKTVWHDKANVTSYIRYYHPEVLKTTAFNKKDAAEAITEQIRNAFGLFLVSVRVASEFRGNISLEIIRIGDDQYEGHQQILVGGDQK